jgi:hypothetical protein
MSVRHVAKRVAVSAAAAAATGTFALLAFAGPAGATGPASGSQLSNGAVPQGTFAPGPFDSGQVIDLSVPANSIFVSTTAVKAVECAAPNGVIPTSTSACDGNTIATATPEPDGSVDWLNDSASGNGYTVYFTPDTHIGDSPSGPKCGDTLATECIIYIGDNQLDFTAPHYWTQAFFVHADPNDTGTLNPGDGTPEVPFAILLPVAAMGLLGGFVVIRRRKAARAA